LSGWENFAWLLFMSSCGCYSWLVVVNWSLGVVMVRFPMILIVRVQRE